MTVSVWEIAEVVIEEIDKRMDRLRFVDFADVKAVYALSNGGYTAEVLLPGAQTTTIPLNCVNNYVPKVGDWAVLLYPPGTDPLLIGAAPVRSNIITNPDTEFAPAVHNHDGVYAKIGHTHDERYYTKDESVSLWEPKGKLHDDRYYTETEMDNKLNAKADKAQPTISNVTFSGAWTAPDAPFSSVGVFRDTLGLIHLSGAAKGGTMGTGAFTLPTTARPASPVIQTVYTESAGGQMMGTVRIDPDGVVTPLSGGNQLVSFDGIIFRAAI